MKKINFFYWGLIILSMLNLKVMAQSLPDIQGCAPIPDNCSIPKITNIGTVHGCAGSTYFVTPSIVVPSGMTITGYSWSSAAGISGISPSSGLGLPGSTTINIPASCTTYSLTINATGQNLTEDGSFSSPYGDAALHSCFDSYYHNGLTTGGWDPGHIKVGDAQGMGSSCIPGTIPDWWSHTTTDGTNCMTVHGDGSGNYFWGQVVDLCPGANYRFTYWVRQTDIFHSVADLPKISVEIGGTGPGSLEYIGSGGTVIDASPVGYFGLIYLNSCFSSWEERTFTFTAPSWASGPTFICMINYLGNDTKYAIDDISLERYCSATGAVVNICPVTTPTVSISTSGPDACVGSSFNFTIHGTPGAVVSYNIVRPSGPPLFYVNTLSASGTYTRTVLAPYIVTGGTSTLCLNGTSISIASNTGDCVFPVTTSTCVPVEKAPTGGTISGPVSKCVGDPVFSVTAAFTGSQGPLNYSFSCTTPGSIVATSGSTAIVSLTGATGPITITCTGTNACGSVTITKVITVYSLPVVTVTSSPMATGMPPTVIACKPVTLTANVAAGSGPITYSWLPTAGLSIATGPIVTAHPSIPTTYIVTATNSTGCQGTATIKVLPTPKSCVCSYTPSPLPFGLGGSISGAIGTGTYYMANNITVAGSVTLTNCVIFIEAGWGITVPAGSKLTLDHCHLFCCSPEIWQGITVNALGQIELKNNTMIEDAKTAINIPNPVTPIGYSPAAGASTGNPLILKCNGAIFNKDICDISISNYTTVAGSLTPILPPVTITPCYPFLIENTVFTSRNFYSYTSGGQLWPEVWPATTGAPDALKTAYMTGGTYNAPYNIDNPNACSACAVHAYPAVACNNNTPSQYGLYLTKVGGTTGGTTSVGSTANYYGIVTGAPATSGANNELNLFDNLSYGIYATNSNVISRNSAYMDMACSGQWPGGDGIFSRNSTSPPSNLYKLWVYGTPAINDNNKFYDCAEAVSALNLHNVRGEWSLMMSTQSSSAPYNLPGLLGYDIVTNNFADIQINNNTMYNLNYGINEMTLVGEFPFVGQMTIDDNNISAVNPPGAPPSVGEYVYKAISVQCLAGGLSGTQVLDGSEINIDHNQLLGVYNGIYLSNSNAPGQRTTTSYNGIKVNQDIMSTGTMAPQAGIEHVNTISDYIDENTVTGPGINVPVPPSAAGNPYNYPIIEGIHSSGIIKQFTECNTVKDINTGFYFGGTNISENWIGNTMQDNAYGYLLDGIIGNQPQPDLTTTGNMWTTGTSTWTLLNYQTYVRTGSVASSSIMSVTGPGGNQDPANNFAEASGAYYSAPFTIVESGDPIFGCVAAPVATPVVARHIPKMAAKKELNFVSNISNKDWIAQMATWLAVKNDSTADTVAVLGSFKLMALHSRYKYLKEIERRIRHGHYAAANELLSYPIDSLANSDSDAITGAVMADDSTADNVVYHYRRYYHLLIKYSTDALTGADSTEIRTLANMCPYVDGMVIYEARALYSLVFKDLRMFSDLGCEEGGTGKIVSRKRNTGDGNTAVIPANQQYTLYPNPSNGNITLAQSVQDDMPVSAEIVNATGMSVYKGQLHFEDGVTHFVMINKVPGLYLLQLTDSTGNRFMLKFVIE